MERKIKIAGVQLHPGAGREKNLKKAAMLIELAASEGAKIVCLPQLFNTLWFAGTIDKANFSIAEPQDGPTISSVREAASRHNVVVIAPVFEEDRGRFFNTAFVIGGGGEIIGKYRKIHVPRIPLWEEKEYFEPGDLGFPVFTTPHGKIGVQICWDVFFPEGFRVLALKGAEIIFAPTASAFHHSHKKWERAVSAAAHSNGVFIFRVNRAGKEADHDFYGRSFCAGPDGEFVQKPSGSSQGVILAEIDLGEITGARSEWVFMKDRRPEEYKELLEAKR